jgi:uncharacterized protein with NRDE domain
MCLLLLALKEHPAYKLILAANRDEFYDRPTAPLGFWKSNFDLLAGRDLKAGGTWLGITRTGRLAAVTNYRDPAHPTEQASSRGNLVLDFLRKKVPAAEYLEKIVNGEHRYNGFNIVLGSADELFWHSNRGNGMKRLTNGVYGLSNHLLDTPWPKLKRAKRAFREVIGSGEKILPEAFFGILGDRTVPPDDELPDTGVGLEWERVLSPVFISSPTYGTRSSSVILVDHKNQVLFTERRYDGRPDRFQDTAFRFGMREKPGSEI